MKMMNNTYKKVTLYYFKIADIKLQIYLVIYKLMLKEVFLNLNNN